MPTLCQTPLSTACTGDSSSCTTPGTTTITKWPPVEANEVLIWDNGKNRQAYAEAVFLLVSAPIGAAAGAARTATDER